MFLLCHLSYFSNLNSSPTLLQPPNATEVHYRPRELFYRSQWGGIAHFGNLCWQVPAYSNRTWPGPVVPAPPDMG